MADSRKVLKEYIKKSDNPVAQIVAGSGYGNFTGNSETSRDVMMGALNQEYALQSMEQVNRYNIEAEERANDYNSMGAQMHRADQAGVSRIAALGQSTGQTISSMSPVAGTTPRSASRSARANEIAQMTIGAISQGLDIYKQIAEVRNLDQNTKLQLSQTQHQEIQNEIASATKTTEINIAKLKEQGIDISNQQARFDYQMSQITAPLDVQQKEQAIQKSFAETFSIYYTAQKQGEVADSQVQLNMSQILLNGKLGGVYDAQVENLREDTILKGAQYLETLSRSELNKACEQLTMDKATAQQLANDFTEWKNEYEQENIPKRERLYRTTERINRATSIVQCMCMAAGTIMTGGVGGVFAKGGQVHSKVPILYGASGNPVSVLSTNP